MNLSTFNVLDWWKEKEKIWPKLAKMAKQYLAQPASSAGPERVFSAAGKMHGDLQSAEGKQGLHPRALAVRHHVRHAEHRVGLPCPALPLPCPA